MLPYFTIYIMLHHCWGWSQLKTTHQLWPLSVVRAAGLLFIEKDIFRKIGFKKKTFDPDITVVHVALLTFTEKCVYIYIFVCVYIYIYNNSSYNSVLFTTRTLLCSTDTSNEPITLWCFWSFSFALKVDRVITVLGHSHVLKFTQTSSV